MWRREGEDVDQGVVYLLQEARELTRAPPLAKQVHEGAALEVRVLDVVTERELKGAWGVAGTLAEPAPTSGASILGELEEGVEEAVHHLLDDADLDLV